MGEVFKADSRYGRERFRETANSSCTYLMKLNHILVIDPTFRGNMARFINHSCDPNCKTQKYFVKGELCVGLFSIKDINIDEELTFNYLFDEFSTSLSRCYCGTAKCKGYLGLKPSNISPQSWEKTLDAMKCSICFKDSEDDQIQMLLCDSCNKGYHLSCLQPKLEKIPDESWICQNCKENPQPTKIESPSLTSIIEKMIRVSIPDNEAIIIYKEMHEEFKRKFMDKNESEGKTYHYQFLSSLLSKYRQKLLELNKLNEFDIQKILNPKYILKKKQVIENFKNSVMNDDNQENQIDDEGEERKEQEKTNKRKRLKCSTTLFKENDSKLKKKSDNIVEIKLNIGLSATEEIFREFREKYLKMKSDEEDLNNQNKTDYFKISSIELNKMKNELNVR